MLEISNPKIDVFVICFSSHQDFMYFENEDDTKDELKRLKDRH